MRAVSANSPAVINNILILECVFGGALVKGFVPRAVGLRGAVMITIGLLPPIYADHGADA
jgi:hypothetical protein